MTTITSTTIPTIHNNENKANLPRLPIAGNPVFVDEFSIMAKAKKRIIHIVSIT